MLPNSWPEQEHEFLITQAISGFSISSLFVNSFKKNFSFFKYKKVFNDSRKVLRFESF